MTNLTILSTHEPAKELRDALQCVGDLLGLDVCWFYKGGFHFRLRGDWTVSITPESAGRLRVETWLLLRLRDRKWAKVNDPKRLTQLVLDADEIALQPA